MPARVLGQRNAPPFLPEAYEAYGDAGTGSDSVWQARQGRQPYELLACLPWKWDAPPALS